MGKPADDALLVPEVAQNLSPGRMLSNKAAIVTSPNLSSDEKYDLWVIMADDFAKKAIPGDDQRLVNEIEEVQEWLTQVEEEMERFYELAPKVKRYFELYHQELLENRRSRKYVEDVLTGEEVCESELVKRSFREFDRQIYGDVAKFNYPLNHLRRRMKLLQYEATKRGVSLPVHSETRPTATSKSNEGQASPAEEARFIHSPDYHSVGINGKQFSLSSQEARIIELLHKEYIHGPPAVSKDYIFVELNIDAKPNKRLRDCFTNREVFKALIRKDRQNYRLNI